MSFPSSEIDKSSNEIHALIGTLNAKYFYSANERLNNV